MDHNSNCIFSVDWLSVTVFGDFEQIKPIIATIGLDQGLEDAGHGTKGFGRVLYGLGGFRVGAEPGNGRVYCSLFLPGETLRYIGMEKLEMLARAIVKSGLRWQVARLDLAFDTQDFSVQDIAEARMNDTLEVRATTFKEIKSCGIAVDAPLTGHTLYFGSRWSEVMLRVYYKTDGSSFGDEPFTRLELELKNERAHNVFLSLLASPLDGWASRSASLLTGYIQVNTQWWLNFIGSVEAWWFSIKRKLATVDRKAAWLQKQIARSLTVVTLAQCGGDINAMVEYFRGLLDDGLERLTGQDRALIDAYDCEAQAVYASNPAF